jgi:hypothetical protein
MVLRRSSDPSCCSTVASSIAFVRPFVRKDIEHSGEGRLLLYLCVSVCVQMLKRANVYVCARSFCRYIAAESMSLSVVLSRFSRSTTPLSISAMHLVLFGRSSPTQPRSSGTKVCARCCPESDRERGGGERKRGERERGERKRERERGGGGRDIYIYGGFLQVVILLGVAASMLEQLVL